MEDKRARPKVLLVSDATWSDTNNIGNTFSNLFGDWDSDKMAMIYARGDLPDNSVCKSYFQIAESRIIRHIFNRDVKTGVSIYIDSEKSWNHDIERDKEIGGKMYSFFKKFRWNIFLFGRNLLWSLGNWKTKELDDFIDSFQADVVFLLAGEFSYMNELQRYIVRRSKRKAIIYFVDDIYSTRHFSISPFFWLQKLISRSSIRKTVSLCEKIYTIVSKQKEEYDGYFKNSSEVINKGGNFEGDIPEPSAATFPLKLVFTGNIFAGRWQTLYEIGKLLDKINEDKARAYLYIYTQNQLEPKMKQSFDECRSIRFMGGIPSSEVKAVQNDADILIHVESLNLKDKLSTRLSFSTKLVDYFERGRCILAIGWSEAASIDYLKKNDAGIVVDDLKNLEEELKRLIFNPNIIREYGVKGWNCGKQNHQLEVIRKKLYSDILELSQSEL